MGPLCARFDPSEPVQGPFEAVLGPFKPERGAPLSLLGKNYELKVKKKELYVYIFEVTDFFHD